MPKAWQSTTSTARDFSVMPTVIEGLDEPDLPFERRVRNTSGSLKAGSICDVEIGARWLHPKHGPSKRLPGVYRSAIVTKTIGALVHLRFSPSSPDVPFG